MSWFREKKHPVRSPISSATCCTSGVMSCDGVHHVWSVWEKKAVGALMHSGVTGEFKHVDKIVQERHCLICGWIEQKALGGNWEK